MRHRDETRTQIERLESMLRKQGASAYVHTDQAVEALTAETEKMLQTRQGE